MAAIPFRYLDFVIPSSFVIRASSFWIFDEERPKKGRRRSPGRNPRALAWIHFQLPRPRRLLRYPPDPRRDRRGRTRKSFLAVHGHPRDHAARERALLRHRCPHVAPEIYSDRLPLFHRELDHLLRAHAHTCARTAAVD